jgi:hypothetical protein
MRVALGLGCAALAAGLAAALASQPVASVGCPAALVHWEWNKRAHGTPWVFAGTGRSRVEGWLYSYHEYVGDGRVNRSERIVLRAGRQEKIGWYSPTWGGSRLTVTARRLDGAGSFRQTFRAAVGPGVYPSGILVPAPGCWRLTLRTSGWTTRLIVRAVDPAPEETCDATPLRENGWLSVTPARAGVTAGWPWRSPDGRALLYAGGRSPDGQNAKVLWRSRQIGGLLSVRGIQLDGIGSIRETFPEARSPRGYWPSTVILPAPGCWLLAVRIVGQIGAAGIVVSRVVSPSG